MNILDTRDLKRRLEELRDLEDTLKNAQSEYDHLLNRVDSYDGDEDTEEIETLRENLKDAESDLEDAENDFGEDEESELAELEEMESEIPEWNYGASLIPVSDWVDYVQNMVEDIGDLPRDLPSYISINWEETADNLLADYSEIEYNGESYYYLNC